MSALSLAEIIEEANRRRAEIESATMLTTASMLTAELARFCAEHGPRLLAFAVAAERVAALAEHQTNQHGTPFITLWGQEGVEAMSALRRALASRGGDRG